MCCPLVFQYSVGIGGFVIGLGQISFFFSYKATEVDYRTWLHVPSGTLWPSNIDTPHVVEIQKEICTKMYTPF